MNDTFCTTNEAAKMLGLSEHTIRKMADGGILKCIRIPVGARHRRIFLSSVKAMLAEREKNPNGDKPQVA